MITVILSTEDFFLIEDLVVRSISMWSLVNGIDLLLTTECYSTNIIEKIFSTQEKDYEGEKWDSRNSCFQVV
jgi:hypothetical protein